jgi:hypothetical protein
MLYQAKTSAFIRRAPGIISEKIPALMHTTHVVMLLINKRILLLIYNTYYAKYG